MGGEQRKVAQVLAVITAAALMLVPSSAIADSIVDEPGVAQVGTYEGTGTSETNDEGASHGGAGSDASSEHSETCIFPFRGDCLFTFKEDESAASTDSTNATWTYYDLRNSTRNGAYVNVMDGVIFAKVSALEESHAHEETGGGSTTDDNYDYYGNNLGYSEEHIDNTSSYTNGFSQTYDQVAGYEGVVGADTPVGGWNTTVSHLDAENSDASGSQSGSAHDESDEYFGIPLYGQGNSDSEAAASESARRLRETLVQTEIFLVNPVDQTRTEVVGLRLSQGEEESSGSSSSESHHDEYLSIFGFDAYSHEDRSRDVSEYALFEQWLYLIVDVGNGTVDGYVAYERGTSYAYGSTYEYHQTDVVGIPLIGSEAAQETTTTSEWRRLSFGFDAADGAGELAFEHWDENSTTDESHEDMTYIFGVPIGTQGDSSSAAHTDGLSFDVSVLGGLFTLQASYVNRSEASHSTEEFVLGAPLVGTQSDSQERERTLRAGVGAAGGGAGVTYEDAASASDDHLLVGGSELLGIEQEDEHHAYGADAALPEGILNVHLRYEKGTSRTVLDLAGFPIGIEGEREDFDAGVDGAVPSPTGGSLIAYGFDHQESRRDYDLVMGDSTIGGFQHNASSNRLNVLVLNGDLLDASVERSFTDSHFFAGDDTEIIDASGQRVKADLDVAGLDVVSTSVFFGYLEFADAIALGIIIATYCVAPSVQVPYSQVESAVRGLGLTPSEADALFVAAGVAVALAMLAKCGIPVVAPLPLFLLSPCILVPVAQAVVFSIAAPLATALLPNPVDDLARLAYHTADDTSDDAYDDLVGCVWFTLPSQTRNPQPVLTAADAADDAVKPEIDALWPLYDNGRWTAYQLIDFLFGAPGLVPAPGSVFFVPNDPCAQGGALCAAQPVTCVAAALHLVVPSQGIDELRGSTSAQTSTVENAAEAGQTIGPASFRALGSTCDGGDAPSAPVCAHARGAEVAFDLRPDGVPLALSALGVAEDVCQQSAAHADLSGAATDVSVTVGPITLRPIGPLQRSAFLLGPLGMVSFDEAFARESAGCVHRYGSAVRALAYDGNDIAAKVVLASASTFACRIGASANAPVVAPSGSFAPGSFQDHTITITGSGPTPTGTVWFRLCPPGESTPGGCPSGGRLVGSTKVLDGTGSATSDPTNDTRVVGTYCWRVDYGGNGDYEPSSWTSAADCFEISPQPSLLSLDALPAGGGVTPGQFVRARGTVENGTGAMTFVLCAPAQSTGTGCPTGGATIGTTTLNVSHAAYSPETNATNLVGTFCWRVEYAGDAAHLPATLTSPAACFTTGAQAVDLRMTSTPATGGIAPDTSVNASAFVAGRADAPAPTGSIQFFLCSPAQVVGTTCPTGASVGGWLALDPFGRAFSPPTSATSTVGTHCWRADYSGDAYYAPTSLASGACFTTVRRVSTLTLTSAPTGGTFAPGVSASASATVSSTGPAPTGTVAFFLCAPGDLTLMQGCPSHNGALISAAAPVVSGVATSTTTDQTAQVGRLCWRAAYSGDADHAPATLTNTGSACFTTARQTPTISGSATPTGTGIVPGANVTASALVSGSGGAPTGRVRFYLCDPVNVTPGVGCVWPKGAQVGLAKDLVGGLAVSNATAETLPLGSWCWRAEYFGDDAYFAANVTNAGGMCFTTVKQTPTIAILASPTGREVVPGTLVSADANFTGLPRHPIPTGTATFFLCRDWEMPGGLACPSSSGNQIGEASPLDALGFNASSQTPRLPGGIGGAYAMDATRVYVGAPDHNASQGVTSSGKVYAFDRATGKLAWSVPNPGPAPNERFGDALAVQSGRLFVGAPGESRVHVLDAATGGQISTITGPFGSRFGAALAANAGRILVGAPDASGSGTVQLYDASTLSLLLAKPNPDPTPAGDEWGAAVGISPSGATLYVGQPGQDTPTANEGRVTAMTTAGVVSFNLSAPTAGSGAKFGAAIAVATNGEIAISSPGLSRANVFSAGGSMLAALVDPSPLATHEFGASLAFASSRVLVGAPGDGQGRVHSYASTGGYQTMILPPNATSGERFGHALVADASTIFAGAPRHHTGTSMGAVHAYSMASLARARTITDLEAGAYCWRVVYSGDGFYLPSQANALNAACFVVERREPGIESISRPSGQIALDQNVTHLALLFGGVDAPNPTGKVDVYVCQPWDVLAGAGCTVGNGTLVADGLTLAADATVTSPQLPRFGNGTATTFAVDGDLVAIAAPLNQSGEGVVHVHSLSTGKRLLEIKSPAPNAADAFATSLALRGNRLAVGAPGNDADRGTVFIYDTTTGSLVGTLVNGTRAPGERFGASLAYLSNGYLAVGAPGNASQVGGVRIFSAGLGAIFQLVSPSKDVGDKFGASLAPIGTRLVIGAPYNNSANVTDSGSAYVYEGTNATRMATLAPPSPTVGLGAGTALGAAGSDPLVTAPGGSRAYRFSQTGALLATYIHVGAQGFGAAIAGNATRVYIGAPLADVGATDAGVVDIFDASSGALVGTLTNATPTMAARFGASLLLDPANELLVGAPGFDTGSATGSLTVHTSALAPGRVFVDLVRGLYCWRVEYSGDALFLPGTKTDHGGSCFDVARDPGRAILPLEVASYVDELPRTYATQANAIPNATFAEGAPSATGSIQFYLCAPGQWTAAGCPAGAGSAVGGAVAIGAGEWISPATSGSLGLGRYCFRAQFLGDPFYFPGSATHPDAACFTIQESVALDGTAIPLGSSAPGDPVRASLDVSPVGTGVTPTGSVTFYLCQEWEVSDVTNDCPATKGTRVGVAALDGAHVATSPVVQGYLGQLGTSVASAGSYHFFGAPGADAVHVVDALDGRLVATLTGPAGFGSALATDGALVAVGAPGATQVQLVDASTLLTTLTLTQPSAGFGSAVALANGLLAVGAPGAGEVRVYDAVTGALQATFVGPAGSGTALALNATRLLAGAPAVGAARLYSTTSWSTLLTLTGPVSFGAAVALAPAGLVIGVPDMGPGEVRIHAENGTLLRSLAYGAAGPGARVGASLAVLGDDILVGAPGFDLEESVGAGALAAFDGDTGALRQSILNPDPLPRAGFGAAVASAGTRLLVGAPDSDAAVLPTGAVHLYEGPVDPNADPNPGQNTTGGQTNLSRDPRVRSWPTLGLGLHCFRATYAGDATFVRAALSADADLCLTIKLPSTLGLDSIPKGTGFTPGQSVSAAAGPSGLPARPMPTGDVSFFLCDPTQTTSAGCVTGGIPDGGTQGVSNITGSARAQNVTPVPNVGKHCWRAEYSGDALYLPSTRTNNGSACFTTVRQPSVASLVADPNGGALAPWASIQAIALVTGNGPEPTGGVDFYVCAPGEHVPGQGCGAGNGTLVATVALVDGSATLPSLPTPLAVGTHCFRVEYAGSAIHLPSSATNGGGACFTITRQPVALALASVPTGTQVPTWTSAQASLVITGGGPAAEGSAAFWLCGPDAAAPGTGCPSPLGTPLGNASVTSGNALSPGSVGLLAVGPHCFRVTYAGDDNYLPASATNDDVACFTTALQDASILIASSPPGPVSPFTSVSGVATASGAGPTPTGNVTFIRCGPEDATPSGCPAPRGAPQGGPKVLLAGAAVSDPTGDLLDVGAHCYRVSYQGDGAYRAQVSTSSGACFDVVPVCPHDAGDALGASVAALGDDVLVGLPFDSTRNASTGAACLYDGATGLLLHSFVPPGREAGDKFGWSVAAGAGYVAIGSPYNNTLQLGRNDAGRVYVFAATTGDLVRILDNPSPAAGDLFGWSLAILGSELLVGAPGDDAGATDAGAVHRFAIPSGALIASYANPDASPGDAFGYALATDGVQIAVGAPGDDVGGSDAGAAYRIDPATHEVIQVVNAWGGGQNLGWSVALLNGRLLAGAPGVSEAYLFNDTAPEDGAAQPDNESEATPELLQAYAEDWIGQFLGARQDVLLTFRASGTATRFGATLAILPGARVAIGAPANQTAGAQGAGVVHVFSADLALATPPVDLFGLPFQGGPTAARLAELRASVPAAGDALGAALAATASGRVIVGAPGIDDGAGAALLYDATGALVRTYGGGGP